MSTLQIILLINLILNVIAIFYMIFISKKKPERIMAWTITLMLLPILGLIIYGLIGAGLSYKTKRMLKQKSLQNDYYLETLEKQANELLHTDTLEAGYVNEKYKDLLLLNLNNAKSVLTINNNVEFLIDGKDTLDRMKQDLLNAKHSIHMMFYIFANDKTGQEVKNILTQKAKEGVEVKLLFDSVGSIKTRKRHFKKFKKAGGQIAEFFPSLFGFKLLNFKANYRNHRKIVVIDGEIAYTGGLNIRNDHMSLDKRLKPWHDTQIRVTGNAVYFFQHIFLNDWRYSTNENSTIDEYIKLGYFPVCNLKPNTAMQVISSGPDQANQSIKECMIKMIFSAEKVIRIQTPYFVPDEPFLQALKLARLSGTKVQIIIPRIPDKKLVYFATMSYIAEMLDFGVEVYLYNGFIHSKCMIVDDEIMTVGTCNMDIRSFALNFEVNAVIYDYEKTKEYVQVFNEDITKSLVYSKDMYKKGGFFKMLLVYFCRLFSNIL